MVATLRKVLTPSFQPKRPWGLMPHGDLWEVIHQHVLSKGGNHITCTKVKGHAIDLDVSDGIASREDQLGNDYADKAADLGVQSQAIRLHHLCHIFHVGQFLFQRLFRDIQVACVPKLIQSDINYQSSVKE